MNTRERKEVLHEEPEGRCKSCLAYNGHLDFCPEVIDIELQRARSAMAESVTLPIATWTGVLDELESLRQAASQSATADPSKLVSHMVNRFLGWKLPEDFSPDAGISFDHKYGEKWGMPTGTNLFNDPQARAMFEHCLSGFNGGEN